MIHAADARNASISQEERAEINAFLKQAEALIMKACKEHAFEVSIPTDIKGEVYREVGRILQDHHYKLSYLPAHGHTRVLIVNWENAL